MAKKKPTPREHNFPLRFHDGLREGADRRAAEDHGGNLTTYLNHLIRQDLRKSHQANRKK